MKVGDEYESPGGMGFKIIKVLKNEIHVEVDRTYRDKDDKQVVKTNERVVPRSMWESFSRAYVKV